VLGRYNNISFFNVIGVRALNSGDTYNINVISDEFNYAYKVPTFVNGDLEAPDRWWPNTIAISKTLPNNTDTGIVDIGVADYSALVPRQCTDLTLRVTCIGFQNRVRQVAEFRITAGMNQSSSIVSGITQIYNSAQGDTGSYSLTLTATLTNDAINKKVTVNVKNVSAGGASVGTDTTLIGEILVLDNNYNINSYVKTL
jgi:hypothetical protein